ncbi:MAG TPA: penicillin-binding transpeptidase domain-containing protein, partial [Acidobacteriaceae bacterium]|nr:penicillin-binding transpeptidase domain-containing protein [Acidobacteriaceae bacterium]
MAGKKQERDELSAAVLPRPLYFLVFLLSTLLLYPRLTNAAETTPQAALSSALRNTPSVAVVLDVKTGHQLAAVKPAEAANLRSAPGSILKPLFLAAALQHQQLQPQTTVFCRRDLRVTAGNRDWNLACTHPQTNVAFTAQEALAYSCNRYFATLADRIPPAQATEILEHYGLPQTRTPETREKKELLVLGIAGIAVSPTQVAAAYRKLALELDDTHTPAALDPVRDGLRDSVRYGMAHNADVPGMDIAGKTGTASDTAQGVSHGWFAGSGSLGHQEVVVVIYLPQGNGADAARLAQHFFLTAKPSAMRAPDSARSLTIELWTSRSVTHFTATPIGSTSKPLNVDWQRDGLQTTPGKISKQLELSGNFRLQAPDVPEVIASGSWAIRWQQDRLRVLL